MVDIPENSLYLLITIFNINHKEGSMCAALVGGMDRLKRNYIDEAKKNGIKLKCYTGKERTISGSLGNVDFVVLFTNKVSHKARKDVLAAIRGKDVPVIMQHSCGMSSLKKCLSEATR